MGDVRDIDEAREDPPITVAECPVCEGMDFTIWFEGEVGRPYCVNCRRPIWSLVVVEVDDE